MQQLILCRDYEIDEKINGLLKRGFTVVPGTTVVTSVEVVKDKLSGVSSTPNNTVFKIMISVVLSTPTPEAGFRSTPTTEAVLREEVSEFGIRNSECGIKE